MVYKKYIKKGGKIFGPYIYESYRDEQGKVRTRYLSSVNEKKLNYYIIFLVLVLIALLSLIVFYNNYFLDAMNSAYKSIAAMVISGSEHQTSAYESANMPANESNKSMISAYVSLAFEKEKGFLARAWKWIIHNY